MSSVTPASRDAVGQGVASTLDALTARTRQLLARPRRDVALPNIHGALTVFAAVLTWVGVAGYERRATT
jgi:hypothetical protein